MFGKRLYLAYAVSFNTSQSELHLQRDRYQTEISALRHSLEMMSTESEKQAQSTDDLMQLREQHFNEMTDRNEMIDKLTAELSKSQESVDQVGIP